MRRFIPLVMSGLMLAAGCVAPMSHGFTGSSLGRGKVGLDGGAVLGPGGAVLSAKAALGVTDNMDIGAQFDLLSAGLFGKNSFINRDRGLSLAGVAGLGVAAGGYYGYAGPVVSLRSGPFEPYLGPRINVVRYGESKSGSFVSWDEGTFLYFQATLGSVLWITGSLGAGIEASVFIGNDGLVDFEEIIGMAGLMIRL